MFNGVSVILTVLVVGIGVGVVVSLLAGRLADPPLVVTGAIAGGLAGLVGGYLASRPPPDRFP